MGKSAIVWVPQRLGLDFTVEKTIADNLSGTLYQALKGVLKDNVTGILTGTGRIDLGTWVVPHTRKI